MRDPDHIRPLSRRGFGLLAGGLAVTPLLPGCGSGSGPARAADDDAPRQARPERMAYGGHPEQVGELTVPTDRQLPRALVVVVHGGFWRPGTDLSSMRPAAQALVAAGYATWNIEYRKAGADGGWPATLEDVAMATDHLATLRSTRLDQRRVFALGHSAGGHLAAWLATRPGQPATDPGANPQVRVAGVVPMAGVLDLEAAAQLGDRAVSTLLDGTPGSAPERYASASPARRLPLGVPSVCVHGTADTVVPIAQSERFVAAATAAGDTSSLVRVEGAEHTDLVDVRHPGWAAALRALEGLTG